MTNKKFNYKVPSILALTLAGTALSTHHAQASENTQDQTKNTNVLNDEKTLNDSQQIKSEVSKPTNNISGTQAYQDPTQVKTSDSDESNYDAQLDDLNNESAQTTQDQTSTTQQDSKDNSTQASEDSQSTDGDATSSSEQQDDVQSQSNQDSTVADQNDSEDNSTQASEDSQSTDGDATSSSEQQDDVQSQSNQDSTVAEQSDSEDNSTQASEDSQSTDGDATSSSEQLAEATSENTLARKVANSTDDSTQQESTNSSEAPVFKTFAAYSAPEAGSTTDSSENKVSTRSASLTEEAATTSSLPKYTPTVSSKINDYIRKNKFEAPNYEKDIASYLPRYNYRYGSPEGIVMHDTANDNSTITGEVNYMKNNYNMAFVHAYVDGNRIIETANTDYLAWGAGPAANERFIHVELVHTHDYDSFARSINNYADYAATNLRYYGLKPDSAEYDAKGTVWTHRAVSKYLGGSDHSDPHGYLAQHGYTYDELYDLIREKYLIQTGQVAPWGASSSGSTDGSSNDQPKTGEVSVNTTNGMARIGSTNDGLYTTIYDHDGKETSRTNQSLKVTKSASIGDEKFYLVSDYNKDSLLGWVHQNDVTYKSANKVQSIDKAYKIEPGSNVYSVPWATSSQKVGSVSGSSTQTFNGTKMQQVGSTNYVYGKVNDLSGWVRLDKLTDSSSDSDDTPSTENQLTVTPLTNTQGIVNRTNNGVFTSVYNSTGTQKSYVNGNTYKLSKKATLGDRSFYLLTDNASSDNIGWMLTGDVAVKVNNDLSVTELSNTQGTVKNTNSGVYGSVYDKTGTQKSSVNGNTYKLSKKANLGDKSFYLLTNNSNENIGWMKTGDITVNEAATATNSTQSVSQIGQLNTTNSGIRTTVYDPQGKDATKYAGKTYTVTKQRTQGDNTYVLIQNAQQNTPIGWVNKNDINTQSLSKPTTNNNKYIVKSTNGGLYVIPWGTTKQRLDDLQNLEDNNFNASKSIYVGKDEYVYGNVNNKTGWIAGKDLTKADDQDVNQSPVTAKNFSYIIYNENGDYYTDPTSKTPAGSLKDFYTGIFTVFEQQTINGVTWYHGKLANGQVVWIKASDLRKELVQYNQSGYTLDQAVAKQKALSAKPQIQRIAGKWEDATSSEIKQAMDTTKLANDPVQKYQFLQLDKAQNIPSEDLNKLLKGKGILEGQGEAFSEAAKLNNINEIYLISHALLETGNGTSTLSNGGDVIDNKVVTNVTPKYYNMFGIGAIDRDAVKEGFKTAKNNGWDTVQKAIVGGAKFIAGSYIHQGQNTLYKMRWNPLNPGVHQYATDISWAEKNATRMKTFYDSIGQLGKYFDISTYKK